MNPLPDLSMFDEGDNTEERCGVIVRDPSGKHWVVEVPNRADDKARRFKVLKSDVSNVSLEQGQEVIGVIHTHPFRSMRVPSDHDIDSIPHGLLGMVYHPSTGSIFWYDRNGILEHRLKRRR